MNQSADIFIENFSKGMDDDVPIVIYGLGNQTEEILRHCDSGKIMGLLDGFRTEGEFCGKPILSLETLIGKRVKIVIVARRASERIIYRRIGEFCSANGIPVYNLQGRLLKQEQDVCDHSCLERNPEELLIKAAEYDVISFDIFDTLLVRMVPDRNTFFQMIERKCCATFSYAKWRMQAELELSRNYTPTLRDIYRFIYKHTGADEENLFMLFQEELTLEKRVLIKRQSMVSVLQQLIQNGKEVFLISDMYLPSGFIKEILDSRGILGYKELLVSCEYGTGKAGDLYKIFKEKTLGKRRLHIGDSWELDGECANKQGIDSYIIQSVDEMAAFTKIGQKMGQHYGTNGVQGMLNVRLFNDPFAMYGNGSKIVIRDAHIQGYVFVGPVLMGFAHWLYESLNSQNIDCVLFISRDGYLIKKIYDLYAQNKKSPQSIYFLTSRALAVLASLTTTQDIMNAISLPFSGTPQEMLLRRFQLHISDIGQYEDGESERDFIIKHKELILNKASEMRNNYRDYYQQFSLKDKKTAIFDFVSTGTCHACLEKILDISMKGFYFERILDSDEKKRVLNIQDFIHSSGSEIEYYNYFLLETWIKSTEPSIKGVKQNGEMVFSKNRMSEDQIAHIERVQEGAMDFCNDYLEMERRGLDEDIVSLAFHMLSVFREENIEMQLTKWKNYDEFSNRIIEWS